MLPTDLDSRIVNIGKKRKNRKEKKEKERKEKKKEKKRVYSPEYIKNSYNK